MMAEFVEKKSEEYEDTILELEEMERLKLFTNKEIGDILNKRKEYEYKLQKETKCKEDYLQYIRYEMSFLSLVQLRRKELDITDGKAAIDYAIVNRISRLYRMAIFEFSDEFRFWTSYITFCKNVKSQSCVSRMLGRMLEIHQDKPKCWHIAAQWEIEEVKNLQNARILLLRGLHIHPTSALLYLDLYKLELKEESKIETVERKKKELPASDAESEKIPNKFKRTEVIYEQAFERIRDIKFIIDLLNVTKDYENTDRLQLRIVRDMVKNYGNEPLMWDTMAHRELQGLPNTPSIDTTMEDEPVYYISNSPRERIISCEGVYLIAVKKLKSEKMWSLYIDCMLEINKEPGLPNLKKKLLKSALSQGHQAKMLREQYYLIWIGILQSEEKDEISQKKLAEILHSATEVLPYSEKLWYARLRHHLKTGTEDSAEEVFAQATKLLDENSLSLWRMKLLHIQAKHSDKIEEFFQSALLGPQNVAKEMKTTYLEWAILTKNIHEAREIYKTISLQPPFSTELHKKMVEIEIMQPEISVKNVREYFELAISQFGRSNVDVWMDFITFEMDYGDSIEAAKIHSRAIETLIAPLTDKFVSEYTLLIGDKDSVNILHKS